MKKVIIMIVIVLLAASMLAAEKVGELVNVLKPEAIEICDNKLYLVEGAVFHVYSLDDLKPLARFGKAGPGPGELQASSIMSNSLQLFPQKIFVETRGKVLYFSRDFKFQKELKKKGSINRVLPVGRSFVGLRLITDEKDRRLYSTLMIFDADMNPVRELVRQEYPERNNNEPMLPDSIHFSVFDERIYVEESERGFVISVFDETGERISQIEKPYIPRKVTAADRRRIIEDFKADKLVQRVVNARLGGWKEFEKSIDMEFPASFPPIQDLLVVDDRIFVSTYDTIGDREKYIIMDLTGEILAEPLLPVPRKSTFVGRALGRETRFYGFSRDYFYYLTEDDSREIWQLHREKIFD